MLSELAIKKFAIIEDIRIFFQPGLSVLTGETGAGKSIIIQAVSLLLGARASADLVRTGEDTAELEACFDITLDSEPGRLLADQGMDARDGLIIRRLITKSGKSRVFINSRQSTLEFLKQLTRNLAGISSQHAHQGLLREENHLDILDEFAGTLDLRRQVTDLYRAIMPLNTRIKALEAEKSRRETEKELIQFQVDEIQAAGIQPGEDEFLENRKQVLSNAAKIFETVNGAIHQVYDREGSVIEQLASLQAGMNRFREADPDMAAASDRLNAVILDLQDVTDTLRNYSSAIDLDPESLDAVDQRLDLISRLKRKYGGSLEALFAQYEALEKQLDQTLGMDRQIRDLIGKKKDLEEQIRQSAKDLSEKRRQAGIGLARLAQDELAALEMDKARFQVAVSHERSDSPQEISTLDGYKIFASGMDRVSFMLSPNPGEAPRPLARIASGGELSRIVLALKAVLSHTQFFETLIFDEVDAGIGGATAEKVGRKLAALADRHQVICITHLAQIAGYGHHQFRISKQVVNGRTCTDIVPLAALEDRVEEIARMMGGAKITHATRAHARELLTGTADKSP
ncbi:MAG: DNA repair protein RecN [Desulfotignum sp.]|nr:DNA repair protein RecN [Desulfotignum sp.]MCF8114445.1 DNA repair protein RecN [Desulfotignum sp.]MCF8125079.1 DNA repair protein RecN [Desulfotignum sp.]